jgi:hypothetical protein
MSNYYLHINTDRLSIELDSDVHYHHHFSEGDILTIKANIGQRKGLRSGNRYTITELNSKRFGNYDPTFTLDWTSRNSARLSIVKCIEMGYISDITKSIERNKKIEKLGI